MVQYRQGGYKKDYASIEVAMSLLSHLIDLPIKALISIVGAGGKTTTMYTLASELAQQGKRVITTTTTHIFLPKQDENDIVVVAAETPALLNMLKAAWNQHRRITVGRSIIPESKLAGLQPDQPCILLHESSADAIIVEADGARHLMIKAPAEHEPVVPTETDVALLLMSAEAINQPLSKEIAHRPERLAEVTGIHQGDALTPTVIAQLITSERGGLKNIPEQARVYVLVTHATGEKMAEVGELARLIKSSSRITEVFYSEQPGEWFTTRV